MASGVTTGDKQVMQKRKARQALWTAEGGKHMFLVFCFSAEVLRNLRGNGKARPDGTGKGYNRR